MPEHAYMPTCLLREQVSTADVTDARARAGQSASIPAPVRTGSMSGTLCQGPRFSAWAWRSPGSTRTQHLIESPLLPNHNYRKYDRFLTLKERYGSFERSTLEDFATTAVSHDDDSLHTTMYSLRDLAVGSRSGGRRQRRKRFAIKEPLFKGLRSAIQV